MTQQVSGFILSLLEYTDKHIEVADEYHVAEKQKVQIQIKMCDKNRHLFITTLHNIIFSPDLCDG